MSWLMVFRVGVCVRTALASLCGSPAIVSLHFWAPVNDGACIILVGQLGRRLAAEICFVPVVLHSLALGRGGTVRAMRHAVGVLFAWSLPSMPCALRCANEL